MDQDPLSSLELGAWSLRLIKIWAFNHRLNFPDPRSIANVGFTAVNLPHMTMDQGSVLIATLNTINCFKSENIVYLGDLVQKSAGELLRTPNFGRLSLKEVKGLLKERNLSLSMDVMWPPQAASFKLQA